MRILAIETSAEQCSVALADANDVALRRQAAGHGVAERALSMIADLLASRSVTLRQIDAFAFASGPGAFTGLRVACGLVQGLAYACDRPVVPVGSLRALACCASRPLERTVPGGARATPRVMVAIDARMNQIYWAVYEGEHAARELAAPALGTPAQMAALVAQWQPDAIAGDALRVFQGAWPVAGSQARLPELRADASVIAELAGADLARGLAVAARDAAPQYVRDQVALTVAQRAQGERGGAA